MPSFCKAFLLCLQFASLQDFTMRNQLCVARSILRPLVPLDWFLHPPVPEVTYEITTLSLIANLANVLTFLLASSNY